MDQEIIEIVDNIIQEKGKSVKMVIPILQAIQDNFNYLPEEALQRVCDTTDITPTRIYGISTFYSQFRHKPVGEHIIKVCIGTACHVKGAMLVYDAFKRELNIDDTDDTDESGIFTIDKIACLGCCTLAPVVQIDETTYGHVTIEKISEILKDFLANKDKAKSEKSSKLAIDSESQGEIKIGLDSCCVASGSEDVKQELEKTLGNNHINVNVKQVGCVGICNQVPMLEINKPNETPSYYTKVNPDEVRKIVLKHFHPTSFVDKFKSRFNNFVENFAFENVPEFSKKYALDEVNTPISEFFEGQINIATEHQGKIKPSDLNEYKRLGGFQALEKSIKKMSQQEVIDEIIESGLKGRGGGGFLTGRKWQFVKDNKSETKYIICNGDEGDPGAFMDRMLLESYPFRIIEGLIIAAYAVGASEGIFYIRAEYPLAVIKIREGIEICEKEGLLDENLFGTDFSFNIKVFEGAGAFVCGEETALIESIEGNRGYPSLRPPYPAESGLWNKPTLINNTETFSLIPWIIREGSKAFNSTGTDNSKGTKVFSLAGKIKRGGLIEVPMGITIKQIVEDIGGGIADNKQFKAVQIGGPSGGCIPASMSDTPIDFTSLIETGAMMGSGGLIVLDETDCMVDIAQYFLSFTQNQSCGRCTFCRVGTRRMLEILKRITSGQGKIEDLDLLESLAAQIQKGSICNLGKTAPNPVLTTLKYFRHEYEAHINGTCPSGKCKNMIKYEITDDCIGCTKCAQRCPTDAIKLKPYEKHEVIQENCIQCNICREICPVNAVIVK